MHQHARIRTELNLHFLLEALRAVAGSLQPEGGQAARQEGLEELDRL